MNAFASWAAYLHGAPVVLHRPGGCAAHWGRAFEILETSESAPKRAPAHRWLAMRKRDVTLTVADLERPEAGEPRELTAVRHDLQQLRRRARGGSQQPPGKQQDVGRASRTRDRAPRTSAARGGQAVTRAGEAPAGDARLARLRGRGAAIASAPGRAAPCSRGSRSGGRSATTTHRPERSRKSSEAREPALPITPRACCPSPPAHPASDRAQRGGEAPAPGGGQLLELPFRPRQHPRPLLQARGQLLELPFRPRQHPRPLLQARAQLVPLARHPARPLVKSLERRRQSQRQLDQPSVGLC